MLNQRIQALAKVGLELKKDNNRIKGAIARTCYENKWFTEENCKLALESICAEYLIEEKLRAFISRYEINKELKSGIVGVIMAGNIPLVGAHDLIMVYLSGYKASVKCSSKDSVLPKLFVELLNAADPISKGRIQIVEKLKECDAVLATGSNNTHRYFEYYFGKKPHVFRNNRNGVAILNGEETDEQLQKLGYDIFHHFGMGCRNVSFVALPKGYDFRKLESALSLFDPLLNHQKYRSNYDYNFALWSINRNPFYKIGPIYWVEEEQIASRLASIHYTYYDSISELHNNLKQRQEHIQCVVSSEPMDWRQTLAFGQSQKPELTDFADDLDTMKFLLALEI